MSGLVVARRRGAGRARRTSVVFKPLSDAEKDRYVEFGEWRGRSGGTRSRPSARPWSSGRGQRLERRRAAGGAPGGSPRRTFSSVFSNASANVHLEPNSGGTLSPGFIVWNHGAPGTARHPCKPRSRRRPADARCTRNWQSRTAPANPRAGSESRVPKATTTPPRDPRAADPRQLRAADDHLRGRARNGLQRGVSTIFSPVQSAADRALKPARDLVNWFDKTFDARGENARLQDELRSARKEAVGARRGPGRKRAAAQAR